jgi:hypothetical protein
MNHKLIPVVAAFLVVGMLLSAIPLSFAQTYAIGPSLGVVTIPEDDQVLKTGVMILGIDANPSYPTATPVDIKLLAEYKLLITYNGATLTWNDATPGPSVTCNILQKDKVNVVPDPKTGLGKQGSWENLMTTLVDVSNKFVCKPRWKSPAPSILESVGVLDVYYVGPLPAVQTTINAVPTGGVTGKSVGYWIADNIVTVEAFFTAGRTVVFGSDIQDLCTLGWVPTAGVPPDVTTPAGPDWIITKPDGTQHYIWANAFSSFVSCERLAIAERDVLGIPFATGQDPLAPV